MSRLLDEGRPSPRQTAELLPKQSRRFWLDMLDILHVYGDGQETLLVTNVMWQRIVYNEDDMRAFIDPAKSLDRTWTRWKTKIIKMCLGKRAVWHHTEEYSPSSASGQPRVGVSMEVAFVREVCAEKLEMFKEPRKSGSKVKNPPVAALVSITPDAETTMGYIARVGNFLDQEDQEDIDLLRYCIKHQHWSVFEQAMMTVEIDTTCAVAAQILHHRSFTFQDFPQQLRLRGPLGGAVVPSLRSGDGGNGQVRADDIPDDKKADLQSKIALHFRDSSDLYRMLLDAGVAKECARFVLPLASPARFYMTGPVRAWIHYVESWSGHGAQREHVEIAKAVKRIFVVCLPVVSVALGWSVKDG